MGPSDHAQLNDVVVVGYGPVGVTLTALLGSSGHRVTAFDRAPSVYHLPRAAHFDAEVMRVFQSLRLADAMLGVTTPATGIDYIDDRGSRMFGSVARPESEASVWADGFMFYQPDLEKVLRGSVAGMSSVDVRLNWEVDGLVEHPGHIEVSARHVTTGESRTTLAKFVIGCDGGRSFVRRELGIGLQDLGADQPWLVVDVELDRPRELPELAQQICDPARPVTYVPMPGNRRRWEFMLMPEESADDMERPEKVAALLAPWLAPGDAHVVRSVVYSFHAVLADRWSSGRQFLAGDAAHQMPPFLGQGMCAGIRDAANLAWKLDHVLTGAAEPGILGSYESERRPHVRDVIGVALEVGRIIQTIDADQADRRRDEFSDAEFDDRGPLRGLRFPDLVDGILSPAADDPTSGRLLPQPYVSCDGRKVRFDDCVGRGWSIVTTDAHLVESCDAATVATLRSLGACTVMLVAGTTGTDGDAGATKVVDTSGVIGRWLGAATAVLIRPDRYSFGSAGTIEQLDALVASLQQQLAGSTPDIPLTG